MPRPTTFQLEVPGDTDDKSTMQTIQLNARAAFVAPPGKVIMSIDYKQVGILWFFCCFIEWPVSGCTKGKEHTQETKNIPARLEARRSCLMKADKQQFVTIRAAPASRNSLDVDLCTPVTSSSL